MRIGLLIWSFNRAAQLEFLLSSLKHFTPSTFEINVLYKATNEEFSRGYELCKKLHSDVIFHTENNLDKQTKEIMGKYEYCGVSTDDTVVFSYFNLYPEDLKDVDIFSLRLGLNTIIQDPFKSTVQPALTKYKDEGRTLLYNSLLYHPNSNYGYQFGHDMVVYSRKYLELIQDFEIRKINDLESWLFNNCRFKINPFIRCFKYSVAVNIPGNNTSGVTETDNSLPIDEINKKFLVENKKFRFDELTRSNIVGCHQLINLVME